MALVSMRQLLDHAAENGYGVPAFNVNNIEQVQAIMTAAAEVGAPVIMQASAGARKYAGEAFLRHIIEAAVESWPDVPVCMHQDHGQSPAVCQIAMRMGFTSVMMDGSLMSDGKTISSYEYNVDVTRRVVENAHCIGVSVEGELGCLGSLETMKGDKEDGHGTDATMSREQLLTDPDQAAEFVRETQLDALAIAIGTSHGAYKFTRKPTGEILSIQRVKEIHERLPNTHLVMHGSSSVPQEYLAEIREFGGNMRETYGVPVSEIQAVFPARANLRFDGIAKLSPLYMVAQNRKHDGEITVQVLKDGVVLEEATERVTVLAFDECNVDKPESIATFVRRTMRTRRKTKCEISAPRRMRYFATMDSLWARKRRRTASSCPIFRKYFRTRSQRRWNLR